MEERTYSTYCTTVSYGFALFRLPYITHVSTFPDLSMNYTHRYIFKRYVYNIIRNFLSKVISLLPRTIVIISL